MGKRDATEEEIKRALTIAQAWDFVEKLPKGLQSEVTQEGKEIFSGGQRQRADDRQSFGGTAGYSHLGDSSSALDFATDAALRRALRKETRGNDGIDGIPARQYDPGRRPDRGIGRRKSGGGWDPSAADGKL